MIPFTYERATDEAAAARAAAGNSNIKFIAGGTNLLDLMKLQIEKPQHLIDITHLPLNRIEPTEQGGLRIGAMVRNSDLAADTRIRRDYAVLSRALLAGASGQLRNMATTGGNLLQRTRCYYFYTPGLPCNKRDPGSGCSALLGFNRMHAIVGASDQCIAVHPSDMAVAMRVLDAQIETMNGEGKRRVIPIADFYRLPGNTPHLENNLQAGELITSVALPPPVRGVHLYRKVRDRASYAFALVSVAAVIERSGDQINNARLAFGGLAPQPWRVPAAEQALHEAPGTAVSADRAADAVLAGATGHGHNNFKIDLTRRTLQAVLAASQRA